MPLILNSPLKARTKGQEPEGVALREEALHAGDSGLIQSVVNVAAQVR